MVEQDIAEYIAEEASLVLGTDIFNENLASSKKEGISVLLNRKLQNFASFDFALIQILIFKHDYVVGNNLMTTITTLLNDYRGTDEWGTINSVRSEHLGMDSANRNIFSISVEIAYKEE